MDTTAEQSAPAAELVPEVVTDPAQEGQDSETQPDEQAAEAALVEIERNGKKYAIPKELEPELLMQSDYTRKAQEVAENRRALEAQQASFQQSIGHQRELIQGIAQVAAIDRELQQYAEVDLNALAAQDPGRAQQVFMRQQQLKEARGQMVQAVTSREQQLSAQQEHFMAQAVAQTRARAEKEIPGWSPDVDGALLKYVAKAGFNAQQTKAIAADFPSVNVLWKAMKYDELTSKKPAAAAGPAPVAEVVRAKTGERSPESMSTEQWMKWRKAQIRR